MSNENTADAVVLREAVRVLRRRSSRPHSFWLAVLTRVLDRAADSAERQASELYCERLRRRRRMRRLTGLATPVLGAFNVYFGVKAAIEDAPHGRAWSGAVNVLLGLLLIWMWWHDNGTGIKRRARKFLGEKSAALRNALVRRLAGAPA